MVANTTNKGEIKMSLVRYGTFFDSLFEPLFTDPLVTTRENVLNVGKSYTIDLPGVKKEDVKVELDDRRVNITWKRGETKGSAIFYVGEGTDTIKASLDLGVLTLSIEGEEKKKKRKEIKIE